MYNQASTDELLTERIKLYSSGTPGATRIYDSPLLIIEIFGSPTWNFDNAQDWEDINFWVDLYTPAGLNLTVDLTLEATVDNQQDADTRWKSTHSWQGWDVQNHHIHMPKMHYIQDNLQVKTEIQQGFQTELKFQVTGLNVTVAAQTPPPADGSVIDVMQLINQ